MSIVVSEGNILGISLGLVFWGGSNLHSNHLQMIKWYPCSKRGKYAYLKHLTNLETIYFVIFWEACGIRGSSATSVHLPSGFTPTNTCPTKEIQRLCPKISKRRKIKTVDVQDMSRSSIMQSFQINWKPFVHRDKQQQRNLFKISCPKLHR